MRPCPPSPPPHRHVPLLCTHGQIMTPYFTCINISLSTQNRCASSFPLRSVTLILITPDDNMPLSYRIVQIREKKIFTPRGLGQITKFISWVDYHSFIQTPGSVYK